MEIYLDNSATTKPYKEVIDKMVYALSTDYANPSSLHRKSAHQKAHQMTKYHRRECAQSLSSF